jgi:hypothetical protein
VSKLSKKSKQAKPIVKVPRGRIGRAVFVGSQVAGALGTARSIRDARTKGDRLALLHGALSAATLIVTALIAVRTVRAAEKTTATESAEPPLLAMADR